MAFYDDMAAMVHDLLAPDTAGGLGQGAITLKRSTPGAVNPAAPWLPVTPAVETETVNQISTVKAEYTSGGTIVVTDFAYMIEAPQRIMPRPGDTVERDGAYVGRVVHAAPFPAHGVPVYALVYVNR